MCALIAMAVYSTPENKKDECLEKTLDHLSTTVDFYKHRLVLSVNGYTDTTKSLIKYFGWIIHNVIYNEGNIGTARAINRVWAKRQPNEHCIKMDDDIAIHSFGWVNEMEEAIRRDPLIGQIGLKRKDCWEHVKNTDPDYRSELIQLPHQPGEAWLVVEKANHVMGSCVMHSSALIDKCGGLFQFGLYGYDDVIYSWKTKAAGFYSCFLPHVVIDHVDKGDTPYQGWKERSAGEHTEKTIKLCHSIYRGETSYYHPFE